MHNSVRRIRIFCLTIAAVSFAAFTAPSFSQSIVKLRKSGDRFQLTLNGQPYRIKGVGGHTHLAKLAAAGGNSIRTWDPNNLESILNEADEHGLSVCVGFWLGHQRHGFNYQDTDAILKQLDDTLAVVEKHKDHPAILLWGVGNEMEGRGRDPSVWYAVNHVAREIKRIDNNHPTMTVIAEIGSDGHKIQSVERFCPDIDIIGINAYGGIESLGGRFSKARGSKPYIVTEHGPPGPWEVGKTTWGTPLEPTSDEKAALYAKGYQASVVQQRDFCLGSYAFLWGNKQETTATWFGMLLPDGARLAPVDVMSQAWTGNIPKNRCPRIESLKLDSGKSRLKPGATVHASIQVSDPDKDEVSIKWVLRFDSGTIGSGGEPQEVEMDVIGAVTASENKATVKLPDGGGGYRLFAYVYDDHGGAAVANLPLYVAAPIKLEKEMPASKIPYAIYADDMKPSVYAPSGFMGNADAISMQLDCADTPHSGKTCLKAEYKNNAAWGGVLWQSPALDWDGKQPGGANLSGATHLEFWARGDVGGELVNFVFGVLDGKQPFRDTAKGELKDVELTSKWKRYRIPLTELDLRQIKTGFGWSLAGQGKPLAFYLDDIRYVREE